VSGGRDEEQREKKETAHGETFREPSPDSCTIGLAGLPPPEIAATVREIQRRQLAVALDWVDRSS